MSQQFEFKDDFTEKNVQNYQEIIRRSEENHMKNICDERVFMSFLDKAKHMFEKHGTLHPFSGTLPRPKHLKYSFSSMSDFKNRCAHRICDKFEERGFRCIHNGNFKEDDQSTVIFTINKAPVPGWYY